MLDFSTVQVIDSGFRMMPIMLFFTAIIPIMGITSGYLFYSTSGSKGSGIKMGLIVACLFLSLNFTLDIYHNMALVKIETKELELKGDIYKLKREYPKLAKEGDKVYYYTYIKSRNINNPFAIQEETEREFKEMAFNVKNQK